MSVGGAFFADGCTTSWVGSSASPLSLIGSLEAFLSALRASFVDPTYFTLGSGVLILFNPGTSCSFGTQLGCGSSGGGGGGNPTFSSSDNVGGGAFITGFRIASPFAFAFGGDLNVGVF